MATTPVVLIVEDNLDHLELTEIAIRREITEVQFVRALSAEECLQQIKHIKFDLVILDYSLPDKNGIQVLRALREIDSQLPVVMVTGQGNERIAVEAMKMGATDYVIKSAGYLTTLPIILARVLEESQVKRRLHETEIFYRDLVENASDGIYLMTDSGKINMVNRIGIKMTGYNRAEIIGKHFSKLFRSEDYEKLITEVKKSRRLRRMYHFQTAIICKSGELLPVELSVIPVKNQNGSLVFQGIVRDISERLQHEEETQRRSQEIQRMNEELIEKNLKLQELYDLKTRFVSNISHELRTPLNGILGYTELLRDEVYGSLTPEQLQALKNIINSGTHLLNLINELLDFAKIQSGNFKIYREPASIYSIVEAAVNTVKPAMQEKKLHLLVNLEKDLPNINVDSQKIYQVLLNILSNAIKFTAAGEIEITVRRQDDYALFSVRDTGIGIAPEDLNKVFLDFHQVDGGITRTFGGAGLGLGLAKYMVESHQGKIWVESILGKGSIFFFNLPINFSPDNIEVPQTPPATQTQLLSTDEIFHN